MSGIADIFSTIAPWLTTALTSGPVGVAAMAAAKIATAIGLPSNSVEAVKEALTVVSITPEQKLALQAQENDFQYKMQAAGYQYQIDLLQKDIDQLAIVNKTMIAEYENADKEAWYQKAWRPACGFAVAIGSFVAVFFACLLMWKAVGKGDLNALNAIPQLAIAITTILSVPGAAVGIAAWHKGMAQREEVKKGVS